MMPMAHRACMRVALSQVAISLGLEGPEVDAAVRVRDELARAEALVRVVQAAITTLAVSRAVRMG